MHLISKDGEQQLVESLDGYEEWTVEQSDLDPPTDDAAELVDGQWVIPIAVLKARKRAEVDVLVAMAFLNGFSPDSGPLAGHTLQVRDNTDRTNWLTSQAAYSAAIAAGGGDTPDAAFRTAENETIVLTYSEGLNVLLAMAAWGKSVMGRGWTIKDAIDALEDGAAVAAFDAAATWAAAWAAQ